ncbi:hypothetical protein [Scleromatobacter humisilvae]|uniref:Lipoprotein n=1 Tax=Scleromatobacter humisilvae TaxID=2897159 RepID=A0A9X1YKH3_9BURK|nr:hypothetical protein [Scleromatobacter humisilvae]MCK9686047.1 hypothetical protein [Scleromatobacter humisilvae]
MRRSMVASCMVMAFFPLVGCGTITLTADAQDPGRCVKLDASKREQAALIEYYRNAAAEEDKQVAEVLRGSPAPLLEVMRSGADGAFNGAPSWTLRNARDRRPLSPEANARIYEAMGVAGPLEQTPAFDPAARQAAGVLWTHIAMVQSQATTAENAIVSQGAAAPRQVLVKLGARDHWETEVSQAIQAGGDSALAGLTALEAEYAREDLAAARTPQVVRMYAQRRQESEVGHFARVYFKDYFRAGKLFQAQLQTDTMATHAVDSLIAKFKLTPTDDERKQVIKDIQTQFQALCNKDSSTNCLISAALGETGFVSRSGTTIRFQGVTLTVGYSNGVTTAWDYPKGKDFAPQMARVLMEAGFDSKHPYVPAAPSSTACVHGLYPKDRCLSSDLTDKYKLLQDGVSAVDEKASRADSATGVATGILIRSFGIAALNNEAAADTIESLASVIARKVTERAAWRQTFTNMCLPESTAAAPPATLQVSR